MIVHPGIRPAAEFHPADLTGLVGHYRADTVVLNGGTVSKWPDISGNGQDFTQATEAAQPAYGSAAIAGHPALSFDGTASVMASSGWSLPVNYSLTVITAVKFDSFGVPPDGDAIFDSTDSGVTNDGTLLFFYDGVLEVRRGTPSADAGYALSSTAPRIVTVADAYTDRSIYENGSVKATNTFDVVEKAVTDMQIGMLFGSIYPFHGSIAELVLYNRILSDDERRQIERYMGHRYGVAIG